MQQRQDDGPSPTDGSVEKRILWTTTASQCLQLLLQQMATDRPTTAQRTVESIIDRVQALLEFPDLGQPHSLRPGVRVLSHGRFRIPYLVDGGVVVILGVLR